MTNKKIKYFGIALIFTLTTIFSAKILNLNTSYYKASIIDIQQSAPFNGTYLPIMEIPNWAFLNDSERKMTYQNLKNLNKIISAPLYNPINLIKTLEGLTYGTKEYTDLINEKITYSVPYGGNYQLDGTEMTGSHPAIDIKIPVGTPIYAIANGVVTKAVNTSGGFGNHIVIGHYNAPTLSDINNNETIYSSYSHLSSILVKEGEIIEKGKLIGYSGQSGIATTPHLHFQIDKLSSPFKPYWPFTSAEAQAAGYSFFQAINNGLGKENIEKYTINPLIYVQKYLNFKGQHEQKAEEKEIPSSNNEEKNKENIPSTPDNISEPKNSPPEEIKEDIKENIPENIDSIPENREIVIDKKRNFQEFKIINENFYLLGNPVIVQIKTIDKNMEIISNPEIENEIRIELNPISYKLNKNILTKADFIDGSAIIGFTPQEAGTINLSLSYNDEIFISEPITILGQANKTTNIKIETDRYFSLFDPQPIIIKLVDENGNITPWDDNLTALQIEVITGKGYTNPQKLTKFDFREGIAIINFTGEDMTDARIKIYNEKIQVLSPLLEPKLFTDIDTANPSYEAIYDLKKKRIIEGYEDRTFKPNNPVARVEALKIMLRAANRDLNTNLSKNYSDIITKSWYLKYIATAQEMQIIEGYPDGTFKPNNQVSRAEFYKMLLKTFNIEIDPVVSENPYNDTEDLQWYAPYAAKVKQLKLMDSQDNNFYPDKPMTRAEIVESIYRLQNAIKNN